MRSSLFGAKGPSSPAAGRTTKASISSQKYLVPPLDLNSVSSSSSESSSSSIQPSAAQEESGVFILALATLRNSFAYASMCAKQDHAVMLKIVNAIILVSKQGKDTELPEAQRMAQRLLKAGEENPWLQEELTLLSVNSSELYNKIKQIAALQSKPVSGSNRRQEDRESSVSDLKIAFKG